ncbi:MAG: amidohydrolase family protein [Pirellulales bacterium]
MPQTRRQFLSESLATVALSSAAATLAFETRSAADTPSLPAITDTHIYLGHWPHAQLPCEDPHALVDQLLQHNITRAWVGSFDALFHKDIAAVNDRLATACATNPMLIPFGAVNLTLPDWEEDLRRCHETFHMPGLRVHPNYHGYSLNDSRFARLLEMAAQYKLLIQLVAWLDNAKHRWLMPTVDEVDLMPLTSPQGPLEKFIRAAAREHTSDETTAANAALPRLFVTGGQPTVIRQLIDKLPATFPIYFDVSQLTTPDQLTAIVGGNKPAAIAFGSGYPLHGIEPKIILLQTAVITADDRARIAAGPAKL